LFNVEKKNVFGWCVSLSFAETSFKEMVMQMQGVKCTLFSRSKSSGDKAEAVSKGVWTERS
jgi:hypothetical protein